MTRTWISRLAAMMAIIVAVAALPLQLGVAHAADSELVATSNLTVNGAVAKWTMSGTRPATFGDGSASGAFDYWDGQAIDFTLIHEMTGLEPGTYTMTAKTYGDKGEPQAGSVMFAQTGVDTFSTPISYVGSSWGSPATLRVPGIVVGADGIATIGFTVKAGGQHYGYVDEVILTRVKSSSKLTVNGEAADWSVGGREPATFADQQYSFNYWDAGTLDFTLEHAVSGLQPGIYTMKAKVYGGDAPNAGSQMYARSGGQTYATPISYTGSAWGTPPVWATLTVSGIEVGSDGVAVLGFALQAGAGHWGQLADVTLEAGAEAASLKVSPSSANLRPGAGQQLKLALPQAAANAVIAYESSNPAVATVNASGLVTATGDGQAVIRVTATAGEQVWRGRTDVFVSATMQQLGNAVTFVQPIPQLQDGNREDFIMGADISTILSIQESGRHYYNLQGQEQPLMTILKENGVNWIRLRLWNDPRDEQGNWYGAGNTNKERVVDMARQAKQAGLKVLVDFHYSDFWADPARQTKPKAWAALEGEALEQAVYDYTFEVIEALAAADAYPDMVQIGNEINSGMLWPTGNSPAKAKPFIAQGIRAVRDAEAALDGGKIKIMIHRANPNNGLNAVQSFYSTYSDLDYDVIGLSYYPFWHGTIANIKEVMNGLAANLSKEVAVAETSYGFTLEDVPNNGATGSVINEALAKTGGYEATVAGQTSAVRDVIAAVAEVPGNKGIGVFYWEPAWLPGVDTGWGTKHASSYQGEEIAEDGGSGWANQALFTYFGEALPSIRVFTQVRGSDSSYTPPAVKEIADVAITTSEGVEVPLPSTVKALMEDGAYRHLPVASWTPAVYDYTKAGTYHAVAALGNGQSVQAVITVRPRNYVVNPGMEDSDMSAWTLVGSNRSGEAPFSGSYAIHFWNRELVSVKQTITGLPKGVYQLSMQSRIGANSDPIGESYLYAETDGVRKQTPLTVSGWSAWNLNQVKQIEVADGTLEIGAVVTHSIDAGGDFDDWELIRLGALPGQEAPAVPGGLKAAAGSGAVQLSWDSVSGQAAAQELAGYNVYVDGKRVPAAEGNGPTTTAAAYKVTGLTNGTSYTFQVSAVNADGHESELSAAVTAVPTATVYYPSAPASPAATDGAATPQRPEDSVTVHPQADGNGTIAVKLEQAKQRVLLPVAQIATGSKLQVTRGSVTVTVPAAVLDEVKALVSDGQSGSSVSLRMSELAESEAKVVLERAQAADGSTSLKAAGALLRLELGLAETDGGVKELATFKEPIVLQWKVDEATSTELLGIYAIGQDGKLAYVGGKLEDGVMTARLAHFSTYGLLEFDKDFQDVGSDHWAAGYIKQLAARQIVTGISPQHFAPDRSVTRAEFAALLVRALGLGSDTATEAVFEDVTATDWYAPAVAAAHAAGIVQGQSAKRFEPEQHITREEMAVMLMRAYELRSGKRLPAAAGAEFADKADIAAWAVAAVDAAAELGLVQGNGKGQFEPHSLASRAETAKVIALLLQS
ncbi:glycosyl hydrolase 53 family protein [Paenibacillus sp. SYP-B4298]|uniref:glycosyl hydrolase 53 family protein n=1 Tax=Paenibacillus sp. SYP-B4298 TaxID=2996034 RepID=UPI0022DE45A2|nr:glycosyl hydrolase 53 family protein [Paenibacillus sp. SYP-B4298]